jgi:hypothetical protein
MSELHAIQSEFARLLGLASTPTERELPFAGAPAAIEPRLAVYRGNVAANARKALAGAYPIVEKLVGPEFFDGLAREYARHSPSREGDLNEFGHAFAAFLEDFPHVRDLPYLPDVARLEWAIHRAHYSADAAPLDPRRLAEVAPGSQASLRLRLHPACALLTSPWPLERIWDVHRDDYTGDPAVAFESRTFRCLVHRPAWRVMVGGLDEAAHAFLESVVAGRTFEECVGGALEADASFDLAPALAAWIDARVIVDFETGA